MSTSAGRIAIFDDDEDIVTICKYILEEIGWEVFPFSDCKYPLEKLQSVMPDIILMDNWIPDNGGIITTQTLKSSEKFKHIPVIYFSANNDIEAIAKTAGADAFLAKPFEISALERIINDHVLSKNL